MPISSKNGKTGVSPVKNWDGKNASSQERKTTIFDIDSQWSSLEKILDSLEEDEQEEVIANALSEGIVPSDEAADLITAELGKVKQQAGEKINSFCLWIRTLEEKAEAWKRHADQISVRARSTEKLVKRLKRILHWFMNRHSLPRVDGQDFRVAAYLTGAHPKLKDGVEPEDLPPELKKVTVTSLPNWEVIRERLNAGDTKIMKWAQWGERTPAIRISKAKSKE